MEKTKSESIIQETIPTLMTLWVKLMDYEQGGDCLELAVKGA